MGWKTRWRECGWVWGEAVLRGVIFGKGCCWCDRCLWRAIESGLGRKLVVALRGWIFYDASSHHSVILQ